jgi:hypothetical protein
LPWGDYEGHRAQIVRSAVADSEKSGKVGVEVIRVNEDFGDVFYFYPNQDAAQDGVNHSLLVAHSLTMANKGVTNPFDEIKYQDVLTSPDGKYAVLSAACWEQDCYQIFDIEQRELHWVNAAADMVSWTPENRLRLEGDCYTPMATACGPYESVSVSEPWIVAEVAQ